MKTSEKTRLVIGGSGLVGSHVKGDLKPSSEELDLMDINSIRAYFYIHKFDVIINCAANVGGLGKNMSQNLDMFMSNMAMNMNLFKVIMENPGKVEKVISFLSTCIFPDEVEYPLTVDKLHLGPPHSSNSGYAYAKRMTQVMADLMNSSERYGKVVCVVPTNLYGPHDNFSLSDGHVIPSLVAKCKIAKDTDTVFQVWGDGSPQREFLYVEDVADIIEIILESYDSIEPLILSTGEEVSIREVVNCVVGAVGYGGLIDWQTDKPNGQERKPTDVSPLKDIIGDYKFTSLDEGIRRTVEFYKENYPNVRK